MRCSLLALALAIAIGGCTPEICARSSDCSTGLTCTAKGRCAIVVDAGPDAPPDAEAPTAIRDAAGDTPDDDPADATIDATIDASVDAAGEDATFDDSGGL